MSLYNLENSLASTPCLPDGDVTKDNLPSLCSLYMVARLIPAIFAACVILKNMASILVLLFVYSVTHKTFYIVEKKNDTDFFAKPYRISYNILTIEKEKDT